MTTEGWEDRAAGWLAWARTPRHDSYWDYRDAFFALLPDRRGRTLDVGCGEGRVARDLRARGYPTTALDASPTLVAEATSADPGGDYLVGAAEALPFAPASFELVVAYNSLMDVADMPVAVSEAARVLAPGGRFCACVVHPLIDAGRWGDEDRSRFVIDGSYFDEHEYERTFERDGVVFTFRSRRFTLESYARALADAGLLIEALREPEPPAAAQRRAPFQTRIPLFLMWRAVKA